MSSSTLIEVFGHIVFSLTRGVTEHYNPEEPEFTAESFGYNTLESTGLEWYYHPIDEVIYQEYSDREATSWDYLTFSNLEVRVMDACSPEDNEETQEDQQNEDTATAWKRLRPSACNTVCKSMFIGAWISLLAAPIISTVFMLISYLSYKTIFNCRLLPKELIPVRVQWTKTISEVILDVSFYFWFFFSLLLLFRPYQLNGAKGKLFLVCCILYGLDTLYRIVLQALGKPYYYEPVYFQFPLYTFVITNLCLQSVILGRHFCMRPSWKNVLPLTCKMALPNCLPLIVFFVVSDHLYKEYNKHNSDGKMLIALFAPLIGVILKVISRICVQRLYNIAHPGYSHVLLAALYYDSAVVFRVLQAELESLHSIAILGIIHGAAEVIERSTMVAIDHICHVFWKRQSAPWGRFRTPRRERLMADIAIMSMLSESTAIVSVNGFLYLYHFIYLKDIPISKLLQSFAIHTSVQLTIEWFFTSMSLAIETRYQNIAVMAVWRRRCKRHILLALICAFPLALWSSTNIFTIVKGRFNRPLNQSCRMPFT